METVGEFQEPPRANFVTHTDSPLRGKVEIRTEILRVKIGVENSDAKFKEEDCFAEGFEVVNE